ncbi:MAG: tetratricopeptide repeat protein [Myxococcales bacterium]|nr:tetratricopeptide repeat protein [Myxococcales bacterium]
MLPRARTLVATLLAASVAFVWTTAEADSKDPKKADKTAEKSDKTDKVEKADKAADAPKRFDANNQTAMSEAMASVVDGTKKWVDGDSEGALLAFRKAVKLQPRSAVAQYALGEALLAKGKTEDAEAALMVADDAAPQTAATKPRIVFVLASAKERLHKWDEAKELWRRYSELAKTKDGGVYPQSATERLRLVDEWAKLDAAYVGVRQRINGLAAPPGSAPAAPVAGDAGVPAK